MRVALALGAAMLASFNPGLSMWANVCRDRW